MQARLCLQFISVLFVRHIFFVYHKLRARCWIKRNEVKLKRQVMSQ